VDSPPDNPAARLSSLLKEAISGADKTPIREVWARVLDVDKDDVPTFLARMGLVLQLPQEIRRELEGLEGTVAPSRETLTLHLPTIEGALGVLGGNNRAWLRETVGREPLWGLQLCAWLEPIGLTLEEASVRSPAEWNLAVTGVEAEMMYCALFPIEQLEATSAPGAEPTRDLSR
jgi:hypothetical protein